MGLNVIFHDAVEQAELKFFLENVEDDRFRYYPSNSQKGKVDYLFFRINSYANKFENTILYAYENNKLVGIIGFRESIWDSDVFGYKCAVIDYFFSKNCNYSEKTRIKEILLKQFDNWCKKSNVRFVTARINVSDLSSIHLLENQNFRFIENILWPIIDFRRDKEVKAVKHKIRFADENDSTALSYLARNFYYRCGRFPADSHFSEKDVANMREKWMQNSIKSNHKIVVVETDDDIVGYFIYFINDAIKKYFGLKFAHLRSAVLSSEHRGYGLGSSLFQGTLNILREKVDIVDSGFITRNYPSMNLHWKVGLDRVVYSCATFHKWFY